MQQPSKLSIKGSNPFGGTKLNLKMVTCPKCGEVIYVPDGKDFVICCDEVIFVMKNITNEIHDPNNEEQT